MRKPPFTLYAFAVCAAILGGWMAIDGLHARLFGQYMTLFGRQAPWLIIPQMIGVDPLELAWPLLVVGTIWIGALCAALVRLSWSQGVSRIVGVLSLAYLGPGTALGLIALLFLSSPATRCWLTPSVHAKD